jgi:serine transporter
MYLANFILFKNPYLSLVLLISIFTILKFGKQLLIKILGFLSVLLIVLLFTVSLLLMGMWDLDRLLQFPSFTVFIKQLFMVFPILIMSFMFFSVISPMVVSFRNHGASKSEVDKRSSGVLKITVILLIVFVLFFVFSCIFALDPAALKTAENENISVLELLGDTVNKPILKNLGPAISLIALTTSFFGVALGFRSSSIELISGFLNTKHTDRKRAISEWIFYPTSIALLWFITLSNVNIITLFGELIAPFNSLFLYFIPVIIVFKQPAFKQYRTTSSVLIFLSGVILILSYYIGRII